MRLLKVLCLLAAFSGTVEAQTEQPGVFHEAATGLTMRFPVELVVRDAQTAMEEGHVALFGSMQNAAKEHVLAARCMKTILLAELLDGPQMENQPSGTSSATLMFFEFIPSKECKAGFKYKDDEAVAGGVAQTAIQLPGATSLSKPLAFDFGSQKLHATFAAVGLEKQSMGQQPFLVATTAMLYHGHILGWLISAAKLKTFNELTKTSIELDDGKSYPLVPFNLDDHLGLPVDIAK
jgi:hypothetical protein